MRVSFTGAPESLVIDGIEPNIQIHESAPAHSRPLNWYDVIASVAKEWTGSPPKAFRWRRIFDSRAAFLSWKPHLGILSASLLGRRTLYLCWGFSRPGRSRVAMYLKTKRIRAILENVDTILVNDDVTKAEVRRLVGRDAVTVPSVVDTDYYSYEPAGGREPFVVVPGDNDRDENLVLELARKGVQIVRVMRDVKIAERYQRLPGDAGITMGFRIPFSELRRLYQRASAVLLPLRADNHAAGQTALLEAVACGAPVVISQVRTSGILGHQRSIEICKSYDPDDWLGAIERKREISRRDPELAKSAAESVNELHHPKVVTRKLLDAFCGQGTR